MDSLSVLDQLLPLACQWVERQELVAIKRGVPLDAAQIEEARKVGVQHPESVRLLRVAQVPMPDDPALRDAAREAGLVAEGAGGMALRYGIYLREDVWDDRQTLRHELAHTAQYERLGGLRPFLRQYLTECLTLGYFNSPLEQEAIAAASND